VSTPAVHKPGSLVAVIVVLMAALLGIQAFAYSASPQSVTDDPTRAVGRASFAYLGGIRTFAAAVLWNRLEPQFHDYYVNRKLPEQTHMLPTLRIVQTLDPAFQPVYSQAAWIVARRGDITTGIDIARQGVEANPRAGALRANLVQILLFVDKNRYREEILRNSAVGAGEDVAFTDDAEEFESLAVIAAAFKVFGESEQEAAARERMRALEGSGVRVQGGEGHDHDSDGTPDH